jgi:hypothetical protein
LRSLAMGISSVTRDVYPANTRSSSVVAPGVGGKAPGPVWYGKSDGRLAVDPGPSTVALLAEGHDLSLRMLSALKSIVYGRNLVYSWVRFVKYPGWETDLTRML